MESLERFSFSRLLLGAALAAALITLSAPAAAGLYCCTDTQGKKVCGDTMPPSCIGRDTMLKDQSGKKQIQGMLTPEQIAQREQDAARKKQEDEANKEQRRQDLALINTYANVKDVDVARERAEKDIQDQIKAAEGKIDAAIKRRKKSEAEAEFYKGREIPDEIRRSLKDAEFEIKAQTELIENKKKDLGNVKAKFDTDKKRYEELVKARNAPR